MTESVGNPHDHFFREMMALPNAAADIARQTLPPEVLAQLDLSHPQKVEASWVDEDLRANFADALYQVPLLHAESEPAYLLILFEHKSSPDRWVAFQVLRYMVQAWQHHRKDEIGPLPIIIPLVLYHGQEKWSVPRNFAGLFEHASPGMMPFIPKFDYALLDISAGSEGDLNAVTDPLVRARLQLLWLIFRADLQGKLPTLLRNLPPEQADLLQSVKLIFHYVSATGRLSEPELGNVFRQAYPKGNPMKFQFLEDLENEAMERGLEKGLEQGLERGLEQGLEQGLERGLEQGLEQGLELGLMEGAVRLLRRKFSGQLSDHELRESLKCLSIAKLKDLAETLLDFQEPVDFEKWLDAHR